MVFDGSCQPNAVGKCMQCNLSSAQWSFFLLSWTNSCLRCLGWNHVMIASKGMMGPTPLQKTRSKYLVCKCDISFWCCIKEKVSSRITSSSVASIRFTKEMLWGCKDSTSGCFWINSWGDRCNASTWCSSGDRVECSKIWIEWSELSSLMSVWKSL